MNMEQNHDVPSTASDGENPDSADRTEITNPGEQAPRILGRADAPIRVLNFAGGGFDTIMQLGVAHALLVIQGRAPDAIVGMSAGAIQAVAVAEVLQTGKEFDATRVAEKQSQEKAEIYQRRRAARVERFREMVKAAQKAPEELIDASLPDAYQIESHNPLQPLRTARFTEKERDARENQLRVRSGLVGLYNDILGVHLPIGVITRLIRRILGIRAAAAIPDDKSGSWNRKAVIALELYRIWLLIGATLPRFLTLTPLLFRPIKQCLLRLLPTSMQSALGTHVATASSLIFRVPLLRLLIHGSGYLLVFFLLSSFWVGISAFISLVAYLIAAAIGTNTLNWLVVLIVFIFPLLLPFSLLVPISLSVFQSARVHDGVSTGVAFIDSLKELFQFVATFLALSLPWYLLGYYIFGFNIFHQDGIESGHGWSALLFPTLGLVIVVLTSVVVGLRYWFERERLSGRETDIPSVMRRIVGKLKKWRHPSRPLDPDTEKVNTKTTFLQWYAQAFLQSYNLSSSLLHHYGIEKFLSDLVDKNYYGDIDWDEAWQLSLNEPLPREAQADNACDVKYSQNAKTIGFYYSDEQNPRIAIGLAVADVRKVGIDVVDIMEDDASVVCGLRAATAWSPLFPPVRYGKSLYVDSTNVCPVPMPALIKLLHRYQVNPDSTVIHVYRVAPVPFSRPMLPRSPRSKPMLNLVDIVSRALKLRQLRDADLERRLTERYTRFIRRGNIIKKVGEEGRERFRIWVEPIELDLPVGLNARIMFANRDDRREEILTTIARGCRAALEVMITDAIRETRGEVLKDNTVPCGAAVRHHLRHDIDKKSSTVFGHLPLPGSRGYADSGEAAKHNTPPGLWEICKHCKLGQESTHIVGNVREQALVWKDWKNTAPSWPHEFDKDKDKGNDFTVPEKHFERRMDSKCDASSIKETVDALRRNQHWPAKKYDASGVEIPAINRPLVSLLFSGGVFRGVFQVGVINALNILGVKPDIVAGASVGSITAAVAAKVLCATDDDLERRRQLAILATTYLAIDRVILTDRFADFIREFTIRASGTRFSLRQADQLFRKYDQPWLIGFDKGARQVTGGIERLLYVSPYQLNQLVKAARHRHGTRTGHIAGQLVQQWLNRMNVGEEVLSAEAISRLIEYFLPTENKARYHPGAPDDDRVLRNSFAPFLRKGAMLLATATDLTNGRLLTLGDPFQNAVQPDRVDLANSLLASSAFPGIFRPRWAQEVFPDTCENRQLIDGGVMDNLPIDAVLKVLWNAAPTGSHASGIAPLIARRPVSKLDNSGIPHLFFAASLEPDYVDISDDNTAIETLASYWPSLRTRANQLGYNFKLDQFKLAAQEISTLHESDSISDQVPLNLEVCALKPHWLCDTYAFHPMLGFLRSKQAASIAHGCAMTRLKFTTYRNDRVGWLDAWGVDKTRLRMDILPDGETLEICKQNEKCIVDHMYEKARKRWTERKPNAANGECWLGTDEELCPFSMAALKELDLLEETKQALTLIHTCCERASTHKVS